MTLTALDIIEITVKGDIEGAKWANVYFYQSTTGGMLIQDALDSWVGTILPDILDIQMTLVSVDRAEAVNIFDRSQKAEAILNAFGTAAGGVQLYSTFVAWGFRLIHDNLSVREGAKRIAGLGEGFTDQGKIPSATILADVLGAADILSEVVTDLFGDSGDSLVPVVVGRVLDVVTGYRLPDSLVEALATGIGLVIEGLFRQITSQSSRKDLDVI